jgi:acetylornithine/succinyldiaminopimelate/putrescine aminotransferase
MSVLSTEKRYLARDGESEGLQVVRAQGSYLFDSRGKKYVDFLMGWAVGNFGWNNPRLRARARRFRGPDYVFPGFSYKGWADLAQLLARITPGELTKCFRATGGTEAVDIALQAAIVHTGRKKFLSIEDSYHGNSLASLSVGGGEEIDTMLRSHHIALPLDENALDKVETRLKRRDVAGFIMEPIIINLGVYSPEPGFMTGLQRLCRRYGTLFIMDEVASGFGRTGKLFATEHFDIEPDIMCLAKAITGGATAMGAAIATPDVAESMEEKGTFYSTFGWHPVSADVSLANIHYIIKHKKRLLDHVADMSAYFGDRLAAMDFEETPRLNIRGLAIGVDVGDGDYADRIQERARRGGLLLTTQGSSVLMLPALNIDRGAAKRGMDILEDSV